MQRQSEFRDGITPTLRNIFRMRTTTIKQEKEDGGKAEHAAGAGGRACAATKNRPSRRMAADIKSLEHESSIFRYFFFPESSSLHFISCLGRHAQ